VRKFSAPVLFFLGLLVAGAVAGATFGVTRVLDLDTGDDTIVAPPTTTEGPTTTAGIGEGGPLAPDQVEITGTAMNVSVEGIRFEPILTPFVVSTPERGFGAGARLTAIAVDGSDALVTWDAGRPFDLSGDGGSLVVGLVNLYLGQNAATVGFPERGVHGFGPGHYHLNTPVAVAHGAGLGEARETIDFDATDLSAVAFTGGASTPVPVVERSLTGPGRVVLSGGALHVRHPDGTVTDVASIELPQGAFELDVIPLIDGSGWQVTALLQGAVVEA
jgi:hypothetical protein